MCITHTTSESVIAIHMGTKTSACINRSSFLRNVTVETCQQGDVTWPNRHLEMTIHFQIHSTVFTKIGSREGWMGRSHDCKHDPPPCKQKNPKNK